MVQNIILLNSLLGAAQQIDIDKYNNYLVLGYVAMWVVVMVYLLILANRQKNAREDLKLLTELLKEDEEREGA
jgi:CcmD family protein